MDNGYCYPHGEEGSVYPSWRPWDMVKPSCIRSWNRIQEGFTALVDDSGNRLPVSVLFRVQRIVLRCVMIQIP